MFQLMLGNFDAEHLGKTGYAFVYIMYSVAAIFLIVVMLNFLIAIITDTFADVESEAQQLIYQEFAKLICDNYHLLTDQIKQDYDSQGNYLFIAEINNKETVDEKDEKLKEQTVSQWDAESRKELEGMIDKRISQMERNVISRLDQIIKNKA